MKDSLMRFEAYLRRRYPDRSTAKHYVSDVRIFAQHIAWAAPSTVTVQMIDAFVAAQHARNLKPRTINRRLAALHTFFEFLALDSPETAPPNPVNWRRHGSKEDETLPRDLSEVQVTQLFAAITDTRDQALFELILTTGLRVGEAITLRLDDLEPPPTPEDLARLRVFGKGRKERFAWVPPRLYASLQAWLAVRPDSNHPALFLNQHGRPLSVSGVEYRLKQYAQTAGLRVSCHTHHVFTFHASLSFDLLNHLPAPHPPAEVRRRTVPEEEAQNVGVEADGRHHGEAQEPHRDAVQGRGAGLRGAGDQERGDAMGEEQPGVAGNEEENVVGGGGAVVRLEVGQDCGGSPHRGQHPAQGAGGQDEGQQVDREDDVGHGYLAISA